MIRSINPSNGQVLEEYAPHSKEDIETILSVVGGAQAVWRRTPIFERAAHMDAAASVLRTRAHEFARLMAREMGKPVTAGLSEVAKCAWACEYFAEHAEAFLTPEIIETDATKSFVTYQPLGVLLAVMPWNFPFWQVFRFAAPALMAGNGAVLKHASNVPGCALAIESVFQEAGFPCEIFRTLMIGSDAVEDVIRDGRIQGVSLTGSTPAGRSVARAAGEALKPSVLELGGSDPFVVLADADLDAAAETAVASRMINNGQSCISAKRFIVVASAFDAFKGRMVERMSSIAMGDPLNEDTKLGPLARVDLRDDLHDQVRRSIEAGAKPVLGCTVPEGKGAYYPASVLSEVTPGMPAFDEELFGPVAALVRAKDEDEAIALANDTPFGLGAAVFTRDVARGERIAAEELQAGCCFVNEMVKSDPRLPFGGIKESGYGRELSRQGMQAFVNVKTVYVK